MPVWHRSGVEQEPSGDEAAPSSPPAGPDGGEGTADVASAVGALARDQMPRWVPRAIVLGFALYLGLSVGQWLLGRLADLLIMVLVALFLSFAIEPGVNILVQRGWRRGTATAAVFVGVVVAFLAFTVAIGKVVVDETASLIDNAPDYVEEIVDWVNDTFGAELSSEEITAELTAEDGAARNLAARLAGNAVTLSFTALGVVFRLLTIGLFTFYLVLDAPKLRRAICSAMRPERQRQVIETWELAVTKTGGYLYSRGLLAGLSAAFHWVAFTAIDLKYALALAIFVGVVSQFIPVIGTYLAGALPLVVALANDPVTAIWVVVVVLVYQQVENYVFAPRITARTMELHPAVAFGAVIAGGATLGAAGALLALPAAAMGQAIGSAYIARHPVVDSHLTDVAPAREPRAPRRWRRRRSAGPAG